MIVGALLPRMRRLHGLAKCGLAILKTRFHIQTIGPRVHYFEMVCNCESMPIATSRSLYQPISPEWPVLKVRVDCC